MAQLALAGGRPLLPQELSAVTWPVHGIEEVAAVSEVLESGIWGATGLGPRIDMLNQTWAEFCNTRRSVALANGTVAIELSLRAFGVGPGDEVIVPAWTFMATASAVAMAGATPIFVDVDKNSLCMNPDDVEAAITTRTRALVPVHFGGHPADMDALGNIAERHNLTIVEDAAQAHGASWRGQRVGGLGDCGSFSLQQSKNLQCGEGGLVTTNDDALADRLHYSLSKFGRGTGENYSAFTHYELAGNACMTELQAALALVQLTRFGPQARLRATNASMLRMALRDSPGLTPLPVDRRVDEHGNHLFLCRYDAQRFGGLPRDVFVRAAALEGVPFFTLYPKPLFDEPMYDFGTMMLRNTAIPFRAEPCPETRRAAAEIVALPQQVLLAPSRILESIPAVVDKIRTNSAEIHWIGDCS